MFKAFLVALGLLGYVATASGQSLSPQLPISGDQRAFPTAQGFGAASIGGRGGRTIHVTNLNDSGPGSLRDAVSSQSGSRIVVFDVGGIINLSNNIIINNRNITIAGQTAPGSGVCLKGAGFDLKTSNIIIRYMCIRRGDGPGAGRNVGDGISFLHATDSIADHLSISWTIDEAMQTWAGDTENITIQYSIFHEPLDGIICCDEIEHGYGPLFGNESHQISFHHNIITHSRRRGPKFSSVQDVDVINNINYNWKDVGTHVISHPSGRDPSRRTNVINNVYRSGSDTSGPALEVQGLDTDAKAFFGGNEDHLGNSITNVNNRWGGSNPGAMISTPNPRSADVAIVVQDASTVWDTLLDNVGAMVPVLDPVDALMIEHVRNGQGTLVDCVDKQNQNNSILSGVCGTESAYGSFPNYPSASRAADFDTDGDGMPDSWELAHGLNINNDMDRLGDMMGDGYTNIEYYLNDLAGDYTNIAQPVPAPAPVNEPPSVSFSSPWFREVFLVGQSLVVDVSAFDMDGSITEVSLFMNEAFVRRETVAPYLWNDRDQDQALQNLGAGTYVLTAVAKDNDGAESTTSITIFVTEEPTPVPEPDPVPVPVPEPDPIPEPDPVPVPEPDLGPRLQALETQVAILTDAKNRLEVLLDELRAEFDVLLQYLRSIP